MLELMPALPGSKPELAIDVEGVFNYDSNPEGAKFIVVRDIAEYAAHMIVEAELDVIASKELPNEIEHFLGVYAVARRYAIASQFFGPHRWN